KDLYLNGLQRVRFLPTIELLQVHTEIVNVDSGIDYRLRTLEQAEIYHHPLDAQAQTNLNHYFDQLAPDPKRDNVEIVVMDRNLAVRREADGIALFEYCVLCESNRSQLDYMEISRCYNTILLANVRAMGQQNDNSARRFIALVDEFYERNVKLIISAELPMEGLYQGGILDFEFRRCLSRLQEMQSTEYLAKAHLP
ncbi:MAG: cell division protein ZapE, partial [Psychrosphaera sp.]|nr:cell division protein ZapE [Psychrosphaera sp.]